MENQTLDLYTLKEELTNALLSVDQPKAHWILTTPVPGVTPIRLIEGLVEPALEAIGTGWEKGIYSLSQVYMSGKICESILTNIIPPSSQPLRPNQPKMAIVTLGDYHLLGKRLVYSILRSSGYELANYGRMEADPLVKRVLEDQIEILLISVLMLPSALRVMEVVRKLHQAHANVKVIVGGAPFRFDPELWHEVGADAYGRTASDAVGIIGKMIGEKS
jgi:methanogenic corrinoid protein MtbC1